MFSRVSGLVGCAVLASALLAGLADPVPAQQDPNRTQVKIPPPSELGRWEGTWFYVNRDARIALWLRNGKKGMPELKLRYFGMQTSESFTTDWNGKADYFFRDIPGTFALELTERGPDRLEGTWSWAIDQGDSSRTENASIKVHRTGDGRRLVIVFDNLDVVIRRGSEVTHTNTRLSYTFAKVSNRLVRWEELPF